MTPEKAKADLEAIQKRAENDPEAAHGDADGVLCDLLLALGHGEVVTAWEDIHPKWYA